MLFKNQIDFAICFRNASKCEEKIKSLENEQTNLENRLIAMQAERKEIEENAAKLIQEIEKLAEEQDDTDSFSGNY